MNIHVLNLKTNQKDNAKLKETTTVAARLLNNTTVEKEEVSHLKQNCIFFPLPALQVFLLIAKNARVANTLGTQSYSYYFGFENKWNGMTLVAITWIV